MIAAPSIAEINSRKKLGARSSLPIAMSSCCTSVWMASLPVLVPYKIQEANANGKKNTVSEI